MNTIHKIAMVSLLSFVASSFSPQAQADSKDGQVERFVCLADGDNSGEMRSTFVKLTPKEIKNGYGYGGGSMALKLSNLSFSAPITQNFAGGTVGFNGNKKNSVFQIYFKPGKINISHMRLNICFQTRTGPNYLLGRFDGFPIRALENGWFVLEDDLDTFTPEFRAAQIERIQYRLEAQGDTGEILIGRTLISNRKDTLDPSFLIIEPAACGSSAATLCSTPKQQ